ncbi:MAG: substrate-binding domain-containing protein [Akkermansiaceae bacterium]|nr:substrate-binding domain-containing protein [Akkermansiaceae bacterium]
MSHPNTAKPRSLVRQVVDMIRERIVAGVLGPALPGEEELGRLFDVSRPTVRGALEILETEGVLQAAQKGVARKVSNSWFARDKPGAAVRFLLSQPMHEMTAGFQAGVRQLRLRFLSYGVQISFQVSSAFRLKNPGRVLAKDLADATPDVWIIMDATPQIEAWFGKQQLPCVFVGGSYHHQLPRAGGDGDQAIRDATNSLMDLGHERIIYLLHNAYGVQMIQPFHASLTARGVAWKDSYNVLRWQDDPANLFPLLERLFASAKPPTAFITLGIRNLLPLLTWTGQHGIRVPDDISIIEILSDPMLDFIYPPITHYIFRHDKLNQAVVKLVLRVAQAGQPQDVAAMIPMFLVPGRSVAPPRRDWGHPLPVISDDR